MPIEVRFARRGDQYAIRFGCDQCLTALLETIPAYARSWDRATEEWLVDKAYGAWLADELRARGHLLTGLRPIPITQGLGLRATLESLGGALADGTVLSAQVDPFRLDTPANHRDGEWLADTMHRLSVGRIHNRGLHYVLLGQTKPDGTPYSTADWPWLGGVSNVARFLGYVPWERIADERNAEPIFRIWTPPQPLGYVAVGFDLVVPSAEDLEPYVGIEEFREKQPYHLAVIGEKSSLDSVLDPIAARYQADLYLPTGNISNTRIYELAEAAARDSRPLVVLYFSDCDPSGWNMPIEVARKLQAFKTLHFPELEFQCHRAALTPDQVRRYGLPISPVKESDKRGDFWKAAMGVEQTEIDALATLQPDLLARIAEDAIAPFYDLTLYGRVWQASRDWKQRAQQALDEQTEDMEWLRDEAAAKLDEKRDEIRAILDTVHVDTDSLDLPPIPKIPEPELDPDRVQPKPLCDSRWDFRVQTERLRASKQYEEEQPMTRRKQ
jgi:hypothetical protein